MAQTINTNIPSITAQRNLGAAQDGMTTALQRLSSGLRVNSARDDAAGLAIAERMDAQTRGMKVAVRNANDGISLSQVAEGGLNEVGNMLQRMRELSVQAANGTNSDSDKDNLQAEFAQLDAEITRISEVTKFNGVAVIGAGADTFTFQVGADEGESMTITTTAITATALDIGSGGDASAAITALDTNIDLVTTQRAGLGAVQSRFGSAINNLEVGIENQSAARSRIVDADFAVETSNMTRNQILQQAGTAMVAQANQAPRGVLSLLG